MEVDSGEAVVAAAADEAVETHEEVSGGGGGGGGGGSNSGEEEKGLSFGGNRWPRQETLALLKIRSDMGVAFRDATHKAPLWDEVSRFFLNSYSFSWQVHIKFEKFNQFDLI